MDLGGLSIKAVNKGLREKSFSVTELVSAFVQTIKKRDPEIHAYLEVFEDAIPEAKKADKILREGRDIPPLFGIPLAIKNNILIDGKRSTAGSRMLENYTATYDSTAVKKLKAAGAIFLGSTNLDEFAMGASTESSRFGPTKNPHDTSRVPGGSSGGSAAAVAADMCLGALASDTGGSIRQPASFCGVVGLKPTYGAVSRHGLIAMASSLDQIGPIAKTVEDAESIFYAIAGKDVFDSTSTDHDYDQTASKNFDLKKTRIGIPKEYFTEGLDQEVKKIVERVIEETEKAGAKIKEISMPHSSYALPAYYIIVSSEVSANLARFDGIRYGLSVKETNRNLLDSYMSVRAQGFGTEAKRRIILGTYALSAGYYDAYYLKAQKVRTLVAEDFEGAFRDVDLIMGPTTPGPAFALGAKMENPLAMYLEDVYTVAINLAGVPAISIPAGSVKNGDKDLPVGVQLIAPWFQEGKLLSLGKQIEGLIASNQ